MTIRHPEKINRQTNPIPKKPSWIRVKSPTSILFKKTRDIIKKEDQNYINNIRNLILYKQDLVIQWNNVTNYTKLSTKSRKGLES